MAKTAECPFCQSDIRSLTHGSDTYYCLNSMCGEIFTMKELTEWAKQPKEV